MAASKIAITINDNLLDQLDSLVKSNVFPDRSRAIQAAVFDKLKRFETSRLWEHRTKQGSEHVPAPVMDDQLVHEEADMVVRAWRAHATRIVAVIMAIIGAPVVVFPFIKTYFPILWPFRWLGVSIYGTVVFAAFMRRRARVQTIILLTAIYFLGCVQIAATGLMGNGRITLLVTPLLALILRGVRAGWAATAISTLIYTVSTLLTWKGMPRQWPWVESGNGDLAYWVMQGFMLLGGLIPLMFLFTRFLNLQERTMVEERHAQRNLRGEMAARRQLENEFLRIGEEERRRLGAELHDGLCQHLTAALLHCTTLENQLSTQHPSEAIPAGRLRTIIEESIGMAYDVSRGLCPVDLDPEGLGTALERLARQTNGTAGLTCAFLKKGATIIRDPQQALHLFRIAQEAATNAARHSRGSRILIELHGTRDCITLRIQDNGVGQAPEEISSPGGMGVRLMMHRAEAVGGMLSIDHPATGGTVVTCCVPLHP